MFKTRELKKEDVLLLMEQSPLFLGISREDIEKILVCMNAIVKVYKKNDILVGAGENISRTGILLQGKVIVEQVDYWGNRDILREVDVGELFAEAYAILDSTVLPSNVVALQDSVVLSLDADKIIGECHNRCICHRDLKNNLIRMLSAGNRALTQKIRHVSKRTTREKLISYLTAMSVYAADKTFEIPFDRRELADYLAVERSAMCSELSKMKKEGMIDYHKNHFTLYVEEK